MHPTSISHIERGINSPTVRVLGAIARQLGSTAGMLLSRAEQEEID
jgi:transcriptional regulator with XRE-family HTH domain